MKMRFISFISIQGFKCNKILMEKAYIWLNGYIHTYRVGLIFTRLSDFLYIRELNSLFRADKFGDYQAYSINFWLLEYRVSTVVSSLPIQVAY